MKKYLGHGQFASIDQKFKSVIENLDFDQDLHDFDQYSQEQFQITKHKVDLLNKWIGKDDCSFQLIYRMTRDGNTSEDFFNKCKNTSPLLILIKSELSQTFGGYTTVPCQDLNFKGQYMNDPRAFIFQLSKETKHEQIDTNNTSIYYSQRFIAFGQQKLKQYDDFYIEFGSQIIKSSYFGNTFKLPEGIDEKQVNNYLAGANPSRMIDFEVYKVVIK